MDTSILLIKIICLCLCVMNVALWSRMWSIECRQIEFAKETIGMINNIIEGCEDYRQETLGALKDIADELREYAEEDTDEHDT